MRSFRYNPKVSVVAGYSEPQQRSKTNWDRIVYLVVFFLILFSLIFYFIKRSFLIRTSGQIITERFMVSFPEDIQVIKLFHKEGDTIKKGDTLMYIRKNLNRDNSSINFSAGSTDKLDWVLREWLSTQKSIGQKQIDLNYTRQAIKNSEEQIKQIKTKIYLDALPPSELYKEENNLNNFIAENKKSNVELSYLSQYQKYLENLKSQATGIANFATTNLPSEFEYYRSPVSGIISDKYRYEMEYNYRQDPVMYISNLEKIYVKAFVAFKHIDKFKQGEIVNLNFPDGTHSKGVVTEFMMNTELLPPELQLTAYGNERAVIIKIAPESKHELVKWQKYHKYFVEITKRRF